MCLDYDVGLHFHGSNTTHSDLLLGLSGLWGLLNGILVVVDNRMVVVAVVVIGGVVGRRAVNNGGHEERISPTNESGGSGRCCSPQCRPAVAAGRQRDGSAGRRPGRQEPGRRAAHSPGGDDTSSICRCPRTEHPTGMDRRHYHHHDPVHGERWAMAIPTVVFGCGGRAAWTTSQERERFRCSFVITDHGQNFSG